MSFSLADNTNGEGSSTGPAPTSNMSATPTGLEYLRSMDKLPDLINAFLCIPEELDRLPKILCNAPIKRELSFHAYKGKTKAKFDASNNTHIGTMKILYNVVALLVFVTGVELKGGEACCKKQDNPKCLSGIFPLSVVPNEGEYGTKLPSNKACANCQYDGMGSKCPIQRIANVAKDAEKAAKAAAKLAAKLGVTDGQTDEEGHGNEDNAVAAGKEEEFADGMFVD